MREKDIIQSMGEDHSLKFYVDPLSDIGVGQDE